jgi:hypothetical protein
VGEGGKRCYVAGVKDEGRRPEPRNEKNAALEAGKRKETNSSLEL